MEKTVYESNVPRVYTLYRVSTIGQVEKDDIPMQKQVCRDFAKKQGWVVIKEFSEKGISGYKVSAKDRDAIQEIQHDAALGKFDILLVFMFDRLGRRDDETPFIVEWFVKNGVEVWSAMEGQQRFDNHVDKLLLAGLRRESENLDPHENPLGAAHRGGALHRRNSSVWLSRGR